MTDKNYCPECSAFIPSEPHKPMCFLNMYPGQEYIHRHSENVRRAEKNWAAKQSRMTLHTKLSYVKSGVRLLGYVALLWSTTLGVALLIASELIGIAEEAWPGAYQGTETEKT